MGSETMRLSRVLFAALLALITPAAASEPEFSARDMRPMTFTLGRFLQSSDCGPRCADFIIARGEIVGLEYLRLLVAHVRAGSRSLPVILHSPGGNLDTARAMGDILAKTGMKVVIARAVEVPCADGKRCLHDEVKPYRLTARGAGCASACALAIAGAPVRIVPDGAGVGVHMPHIPDDPLIFDEEVRQHAETISVVMLRSYYAKHGIKPAVMDLLLATPSSEIRWLTRAELLDLGFIDDRPQSLPSAAPEEAPGSPSVSRQRP